MNNIKNQFSINAEPTPEDVEAPDTETLTESAN